MYCPSCGTLNDDNNFRCVQCGSVIQTGHQAQPQQPYGGDQYGGSPYGGGYPEASQATTAIVLAALSFVCLGILLAIPAIILARSEISAINAGRRDPSKKGVANAAFWIGIVSMVLNTFWLIYVFTTPGAGMFWMNF